MEKRKRKRSLLSKKEWSILLIEGILVIVGFILYAIIRGPTCLPDSHDYIPQLSLPPDSIKLVRQSSSARGDEGVYTVDTIDDEELIAFFENELSLECIYSNDIDARTYASCSGNVERFARAYINIFATDEETQITRFNVSVLEKMCDED